MSRKDPSMRMRHSELDPESSTLLMDPGFRQGDGGSRRLLVMKYKRDILVPSSLMSVL